MNQQNTVAGQSTPAAPTYHLVERMTQLETEIAELKALIHKFAPAPARPPIRKGYAWIEPPLHLQGVTDYDQVAPENLVYLHELTADDVRRRLEELEQWYGMSSEEFYNRWQSGAADDIFEKTEWQMLYKLWRQIQSQSAQLEEVHKYRPLHRRQMFSHQQTAVALENLCK